MYPVPQEKQKYHCKAALKALFFFFFLPAEGDDHYILYLPRESAASNILLTANCYIDWITIKRIIKLEIR